MDGVKDFADLLALDDAGRERAVRSIGRPRETVIRATIETANDLAPHLDDLAHALTQANDEAGARIVLEEWAKRTAEDPAIAAGFYRANLLTHMAGALFVADIEAAGVARRLSDGGPQRAFLQLDFPEAVDHFQARRVLSREEFEALDDAERFRSFTMAHASSDRIAGVVKKELESAMTPGGLGLRAFQEQFAASVLFPEDGSGFKGTVQSYLENVYRTSTATSYGAGRFEMQTDPDVVEALPYWVYLTANDSRVRDEHAALHEKAWPAGDPEAVRVYPPNGYQCRCVMVCARESRVTKTQLSKPVNVDAAIQEGFAGSPVGAVKQEAGVQ